MPEQAPAAPPPSPVQAQAYDLEGKPISADGDDLTKLVASGSATFQKGATVHVVQPNGQVGTIKAEDAQKATAQGMRLASQQEIHHAQAEAKYGGAGGQVMSGVLGGLSQATMGVSDAAISALGGREYLEQHEEANPLANAIGGVVGGVAPLFLPGAEEAGVAEEAEGLSALAKAAQATGRTIGAPTRALARAGSAVEDTVAKWLGTGEGESAVTALAKKVLSKGAGAAVEGGLVGLDQHIDEHILQGDPEINGEKVLAATGHGMLLGLAAGAGLTAAGEIGSAVLGRMGSPLRTMANEQAVRALNMRKFFTKEADRIPGKFEGIGETLLNTEVDGQPLLKFGDRVQDIAPRLQTATDEADAKIGTIYRTLDESTVPKVTLGEIGESIKRDVRDELAKMPKTNKGAIAAIDDWLSDTETRLGIPSEETAKANNIDRAEKVANHEIGFQELRSIRSDLGKTINWKTPLPGATIDEKNEALKDIYFSLTDAIQSRAEKAAQKLGGRDLLAELKEANLNFRRLNLANNAAQDAVFRHEANRVISPSDYITGAAAAAHHAGGALLGGAVGAAAGAEEGGGGGSMLGGFATGAMAALAHHAIRTRGNAAAAVLLDKLASLRGIERAVQHVDTQIERGVGGFFKEGGRVPIKLREPIEAAKGEHVAETAQRAVTQAAANHETHIADIAKAAAPIDAHAPQTSNSFQRAALRATTYLASVAPRPQIRPSLTPQFDKPMLTSAQKADYARVVAAVHDPATVLQDMADGRVTRSQVDAIRMVYPALFADIEQRIHERLASLKEPLTSAQKTQLATVLGIAPDATYEAGFIQAMQGTYGQAPPPQGGGGKGRGGGTVKRPLKDNMAQDVALSLGGHGKGA